MQRGSAWKGCVDKQWQTSTHLTVSRVLLVEAVSELTRDCKTGMPGYGGGPGIVRCGILASVLPFLSNSIWSLKFACKQQQQEKQKKSITKAKVKSHMSQQRRKRSNFQFLQHEATESIDRLHSTSRPPFWVCPNISWGFELNFNENISFCFA